MNNWGNYEDKLRQMGLRIKYYRMLKSLSQKDLAEKIGVTGQQISRIESPNNVYSTKIDTLLAIADALDVNVARFFED